RCATQLGINTFRITGGEPLLRNQLHELIARLIRIPGVHDIALTTNATLLKKYAHQLYDAGLRRINVSLDSLNAQKLERMSGAHLSDILDGIEVALAIGFEHIKINCVVMRDFNTDEIEQIAMLSYNRPLHVRFIEYQPIGCAKVFFNDIFVPIDEARQRLIANCSIEPISSAEQPPGAGPARYWRIPGGRGTIGFIAPISEPFCERCNRLRITPDSFLRPCLAYEHGINLMPILRGGSDDELEWAFRKAVALKPHGHDFHARLQVSNALIVHRSMQRIGG
ncbi:MAG TPA: radical SAM protein, partial [Armatimonadetes bacterium]|nr:radical SAM protein [Armatimonadota bacterium]